MNRENGNNLLVVVIVLLCVIIAGGAWYIWDSKNKFQINIINKQEEQVEKTKEEQKDSKDTDVALYELAKRIAMKNNTSINKQGFINGNEVILRSEPSISGRNISVMYRGNRVEVLEKVECNDPSAAILNKDNVTLSYNDHSKKVLLRYGQALRITSEQGKDLYCDIKVGDEIVNAKFNASIVKRIYGDTWYRVRNNTGIEGYILGQYINI